MEKQSQSSESQERASVAQTQGQPETKHETGAETHKDPAASSRNNEDAVTSGVKNEGATTSGVNSTGATTSRVTDETTAMSGVYDDVKRSKSSIPSGPEKQTEDVHATNSKSKFRESVASLARILFGKTNSGQTLHTADTHDKADAADKKIDDGVVAGTSSDRKPLGREQSSEEPKKTKSDKKLSRQDSSSSKAQNLREHDMKAKATTSFTPDVKNGASTSTSSRHHLPQIFRGHHGHSIPRAGTNRQFRTEDPPATTTATTTTTTTRKLSSFIESFTSSIVRSAKGKLTDKQTSDLQLNLATLESVESLSGIRAEHSRLTSQKEQSKGQIADATKVSPTSVPVTGAAFPVQEETNVDSGQRTFTYASDTITDLGQSPYMELTNDQWRLLREYIRDILDSGLEEVKHAPADMSFNEFTMKTAHVERRSTMLGPRPVKEKPRIVKIHRHRRRKTIWENVKMRIPCLVTDDLSNVSVTSLESREDLLDAVFEVTYGADCYNAEEETDYLEDRFYHAQEEIDQFMCQNFARKSDEELLQLRLLLAIMRHVKYQRTMYKPRCT